MTFGNAVLCVNLLATPRQLILMIVVELLNCFNVMQLNINEHKPNLLANLFATKTLCLVKLSLKVGSYWGRITFGENRQVVVKPETLVIGLTAVIQANQRFKNQTIPVKLSWQGTGPVIREAGVRAPSESVTHSPWSMVIDPFSMINGDRHFAWEVKRLVTENPGTLICGMTTLVQH